MTVAVGQLLLAGAVGGDATISKIVCDGSWHFRSTRVEFFMNEPVDITEPLGVYARMTVGYAQVPTPPFGMIVEDQLAFRLD